MDVPADGAEREGQDRSVVTAEGSPPGAADAPEADTPKARFYAIDLRRCSAGEIRRGTKRSGFVSTWLSLKVFRARVPASLDHPAVDDIDAFCRPELRLHPSAKEKFDSLVAGLRAIGFLEPVYYSVDDFLSSTGNYMAAMGHPTRPIVARVHLRIWTAQSPATSVLFTEMLSARADGSTVWTMSLRRMIEPPASCRVVEAPGAEPAALLEAHERAIDEGGHAGLLPTGTTDETREVVRRFHGTITEWFVRRGVFVERTPDEEARAAAVGARYDAASRGTLKHPNVLAEIDALLGRKSSWVGGIVLLLVTVALFLGVGVSGVRSFGRLLALVPVLLFHEAGHYLAMRVSGYRNVRMFFLPGFGAAVSGRSFNVAGWKKVVVALMGPVPGIVLGIIVGLCGLVLGRGMLLEAGSLLVFLNGFNLIPILPLDGGQVAHAILFSRHYILDVVFRVLAAAAVIGMALLTPGKVFLFVGVALLINVPNVLREARVVRELRREGFRPVSPDNQSIPPEVCDRIVDKLKASSTKPLPAKLLAQQTLQVFETLNTRSPGWLASIGLLTVYGASLLAAVVFSGLFVLAQQGRLGEVTGRGWRGPHIAVVAADIRSSGTAPSEAKPTTIVATFKTVKKAMEEYQRLSASLGTGESAVLLGQTVLLRVPGGDEAARTRRYDELKALGADAFVAGQGMSASLRVMTMARDEAAAKAVAEELGEYFDLPLSQGIIAPWSQGRSITPAQALARKTLSRLRSTSGYDDPAVQELEQQSTAARRRGETARAKELGGQIRERAEKARRAGLERIAAEGPETADVELARRYLELYDRAKPEERYRLGEKEFAAKLGTVAPSDGRGDATWADFGFASSTGRAVRVQATMHDPTEGAPALLRWLEARGCAMTRYDFVGNEEGEDDGD